MGRIILVRPNPLQTNSSRLQQATRDLGVSICPSICSKYPKLPPQIPLLLLNLSNCLRNPAPISSWTAMRFLFALLSLFSRRAQSKTLTLALDDQKRKSEEEEDEVEEMELRPRKGLKRGADVAAAAAAKAERASKRKRPGPISPCTTPRSTAVDRKGVVAAAQRTRKRQRTISSCTSPQSPFLTRHSEFNWWAVIEHFSHEFLSNYW